MGRSKAKKQQAKVDKPGPDDFTYLAVFFPVGRNGAAMAKESDPADKAAATRIGTWMHHAGLPIRKLFSRKSEEHVLVEVREEVPQEVIDSKLGAYKWGDMLHSILPKDVAAESTIMRAKVRSHDAVEKMGGMVYFPIPRIAPDGPRAESRFKEPFPRPRKHSLTEPSTFSAIKYLPLPLQLAVPRQTDQEDVKPKIAEDEETKPDAKPNIKPEPDQDVKPGFVKEESKRFITGDVVPTGDANTDGPDTKPWNVKPEEGQQPFSLTANQPNVRTHPDAKPKIKTKTEAEAEPDSSDTEIPIWDMMVDEGVCTFRQTVPPTLTDWVPTAKPKVETKTEAENAAVLEDGASDGMIPDVFDHVVHTDPILVSRNAAELSPSATQPTNPNRVAEDGPGSSDAEIPVWDMMVDEAKPKIEIKADAETGTSSSRSQINVRNSTVFGVFGRFIRADPIVVSENTAKPSLSALRLTDPNGEAETEPDSSDTEIPVWDMMVDEAMSRMLNSWAATAKPKVEVNAEAEN
ncbi:hypothetical protein FRC10_010679, partial [Ceratobasidium sp. 414]